MGGLKLLCTAPLKTKYAADFAALGASVSELALDGTIADPADRYDAVFVSPEAFELLDGDWDTGVKKLIELWGVVTGLVEKGMVGWVHMPFVGLDDDWFGTPPMIKACNATGTKLTHSPGVSANAIGEFVLAHMLSVYRKIPEHAINQAATKWVSLPQMSLQGKTLSIVGAGGIGRESARLAKAFGMRVLGMRRTAGPMDNFDEVLQSPEGLSRLLTEADFFLLCVPLKPSTKGLIGAAELKLLKPTCWLINVARGAVVNDKALIEALQSSDGPAGAILDTPSEVEPMDPESPLWKLPNVVVTPHDSYRTQTTDENRYFLDNLGRLQRGEALKGTIIDMELLAPHLQSKL